jgi:glyoxylase-like metal-dependent hydrolase (beta-lactamase superfamily II)/Tfp pilus assembly protein PilF
MTKITRIAASLAVLSLLVLPLKGAEDEALREAWKRIPAAERHFQDGLTAFNAGRSETAAAAFEKCLREMPRHAFAHYYLANIFYVGKDLQRSLGHMEQALADLAFMEALNDYATNKKSRTFDSYAQMLASEWDNTGSCRTRRQIESLAGELADTKSKQELRVANQEAARSLQKAHYLYFLGNIYFQLRRFPEAVQKYREAIELNPRHASAYNNIAAISYMAGDLQGALDYLERAGRQGLEDNLNLKLQFLVHEALGRPTEGILQEDLSAGAQDDLGAVRFALAFKSKDALLPPLYENGYVVFSKSTRQAVLIDIGVADPRIDEFVRAQNLEVKAILNTHGHEDHTGAAAHYSGLFRAPVLVHAKDAKLLVAPPAGTFTDGEILRYAGFEAKVLHLPGHTPGSVCFLVGDILFSGDALFKGGIGKIEAENQAKAAALQEAMVRSIRDRLLALPDATRLCPGHGKTSTIGEEKATNPFLTK